MSPGTNAGAARGGNGSSHDEALLALVRKIAGEARPGEQVEAYAGRSKGVEVKVFGGEVESLASENVEGVGVRVVVDGRQGFAWAGSL
ncbi:MAG TPA: DNA gyrase modulator, partial [Acidimicrobiia bacterium]|nr:DNA gyrase modulator [Acidimicrobiia bacterium]